MASSEVYKVVLSGGAPWGFRLQGGSEFRAPLRIAKITPGSKAQKANIYEGLYVRAINDTPSDKLTHGDALNIVKKTGDELELELGWKLPESSPSQPSTGQPSTGQPSTGQPSTGGSYTTEDIKTTHISKATFKPSYSEAPPYATLPRGGQGWQDVDENFNTTYVSEVNSKSEWDPEIISNITRPPEPIQLLRCNESIRSASSTGSDFPPPPEVHRGFEKPQPIGRGARRFDEPDSNRSDGIRPPLTSSSIGSDEDFNMANGDASSQDSSPQQVNTRPAMNQFRKQKVNAEIEATREAKPILEKEPPPPPAKPERRYPNIMESEKYTGPSRPAIKRGGKWYKEMFKEMHATAGVSSNLSALLATDATKTGSEPSEGLAGDFVHPMEARAVELQPEYEYEPETYDSFILSRKTSAPASTHMVSKTGGTQPRKTSAPPTRTHPVSMTGGTQPTQDNVPAWHQDLVKGDKLGQEEPLSYGIHHRKPSYDSDEGKSRFSGLHPAVHANRPPDYVSPLSKTAADRPLLKSVPTTVTVQQEERSKPPSASSLYESRFKSGATPTQDRKQSASEALGVQHQPPSDDDLIKKREEEARHRREEEERRRKEEEQELLRLQQEERERKEHDAEMRRRKQEAEAAARKTAGRPQFFAMALYNFVGQSAKELSFKKGDYIIVKKQIDKNWIEGEINGKSGIFPTNYVELRPIDDEEEFQEESPPSPYVAVEGEAKLKYNFKAESTRELSVGKNEIVTLTRKVDQNWYEGISQGRKGIIPSAYLEIYREPGLAPKGNVSPKATAAEQPRRQETVQQQQIRPAQSQEVSETPQQLTEIRKTITTTTTYDKRPEQSRSYGEPIRIAGQGQGHSPPQAQVQYIKKEPEPAPLPVQAVEDHDMFPMEGERYKAAYSYAPQNDDELPLEEGEEVIVLEKCDDGWFVGHSTRTGLFGTFPGNYVVGLCK